MRASIGNGRSLLGLRRARPAEDGTEQDAAACRAGTPADWALESHDLAVQSTYAGIPVGGPPVEIDAAYIDRNRIIVQRQLMKAGVRLATLLNQALP